MLGRTEAEWDSHFQKEVAHSRYPSVRRPSGCRHVGSIRCVISIHIQRVRPSNHQRQLNLQSGQFPWFMHPDGIYSTDAGRRTTDIRATDLRDTQLHNEPCTCLLQYPTQKAVSCTHSQRITHTTVCIAKHLTAQLGNSSHVCIHIYIYT